MQPAHRVPGCVMKRYTMPISPPPASVAGEGLKWVGCGSLNAVARRSGYGATSGCRTFQRRSLHNPICRPSPSCNANRRFVESAIYILASRLRASWMEARATKAPRVSARFSKSLETPVASEPGESALDHRAARQDDEALRVVAPLDDLHAQPRHFCQRSVNLPGIGAAVSPDQFEPG